MVAAGLVAAGLVAAGLVAAGGGVYLGYTSVMKSTFTITANRTKKG